MGVKQKSFPGQKLFWKKGYMEPNASQKEPVLEHAADACPPGVAGLFHASCSGEDKYKWFWKNWHWLHIKGEGGEVGAGLE